MTTIDNGRPCAIRQPKPPTSSPSSTTIRLATYNIQDGCNGRLAQTCRVLAVQQIDLAILTELRIPATDPIHTRHCEGYDIWATYSVVQNQGGIALATRAASKHWHIESPLRHGPNVLSCLLVTGSTSIPLVGAYLPPSHLDDLPHLENALNRFRHRTNYLLLGDLNADITQMDSPRNQAIASILTAFGLEDMLLNFQQPKAHRSRTTWHQTRQGRPYSSRPDYILSCDRRNFKKVSIKNPRHFSSDHYMIIADWYGSTPTSHSRYLRGRRRLPFKHPIGPATRADTLFGEIRRNMDPLPRKSARHPYNWLSSTTTQLIDRRCSLRGNRNHDRAKARRLSRAITQSIKRDRKARTERAGTAIQAALDGPHGDLQGAYRILQRWYRHNGDRPPKPTRQDLQTTTNEFADLYAITTPPGDPIPVHVQPQPIPDTVPTEDEILDAVKRLHNGKTPGPSRLQGEQIKKWVRLAYPEATETDPSPVPDTRRWQAVVRLIQHQFATGDVATEVAWSFLALLPKPDGGKRGVGLIETIWKLTEAIVDTRIKAYVQYHDLLHGFTAHRGTGTAILEAKLQQELAGIRQQPLFHVYLDLKKAYDKLHRGRALDTLQAYGVGPNTRRLIANYWDKQQIAARQAGYHGPCFTAGSGATQGGLLSPNLFNICVDSVVRHWLTLVIDDNGAVVTGLGPTVEDKLALFYADDGLVSSVQHEWLQQALQVLVELFTRIGLQTNTRKTQQMTCFPPTLTTRLSDAGYTRRITGTGLTYRDRQRQKINCPRCDKSLTRGALKQHLRSIHGEDPMETTLAYKPTLPPQTYRISFPRTSARRDCPVPGCIGGGTTHANLRYHFMMRHPTDTLCILEEGSQPLPKCLRCNMHIPYSALNSNHTATAACRRGATLHERRLQVARLRRSNEQIITVNGTDLERVPQFCYLGRVLSLNNSDWPAVYKNIRKAKQKWALISRPLIRTGVAPQVVGLFYKAIVQAVLLYASETWTTTPQMLRLLTSFHHRIARRISNKMPFKNRDDQWVYPPIEEALAIAGLHSLEHYIRVRQITIEQYIATRPILDLCQKRIPPTQRHTRLYWWTQTLQLSTPPLQETEPPQDPPHLPQDPAHRPPSPAASTRSAAESTTYFDTQSTLSFASISTHTSYATPEENSVAGSIELTIAQTDAPPLSATIPVHPTAPTLVSDLSSNTPQLTSSTTFMQLTPTEQQIVQTTLSQPTSDRLLTAPGLPPVTVASLRTLTAGEWLNDEIINHHLRLLQLRDEHMARANPTHQQSYCFHPLFMSTYLNTTHADPRIRGRMDYTRVRRWSRRTPTGNLFDLHHLFIPIHVGRVHWTHVVVDFLQRTITYRDSQGAAGLQYLTATKQYLNEEHQKLHRCDLPPGWNLVPTPDTTPRQQNGDDCGVYTCAMIDLALQRRPLELTPADILIYRNRMVLAILQGAVPWS